MNCEDYAYKLKNLIINMAEYCNKGEGYWGGYMSLVDVLSVLFCEKMNFGDFGTEKLAGDKLILSKGHSGLALYCAMHLSGLLDEDTLMQYGKSGSGVTQLASYNSKIGIELSAGSLGLGLPYAVGIALLAKKIKSPSKIFVIVGDGEIQEGANWEALMCAYKYKLNNLILIVDNNKYQSDGACEDIMPLRSLKEKIDAFGWTAVSVNGHNHDEIRKALSIETSYPLAIIANTEKGHGISFMENNNSWHHTHLEGLQLEQARNEVGKK